MRLWAPVAAATMGVVAYVFFYELSAAEAQGSSSLGLANAAGLVAVLLGLIVAGFILRRGAAPPRTSDSRNP